jgi:nucleoside-diphosphate-sugar epimerase
LRVLVSGAGGFIGRHFATILSGSGHDVIGLVRRSRPAGLEDKIGVRLECADLTNVSDNLPTGPFDALIHCAAAIPSAVPNDCELIRINVDGASRLFEHALRAGVSTIIFCSSMAAYGRIEVDLVDPDTQIRDPNAYGRSKLVCEGLLQMLCQSYPELRALSIRLPGIVGPGSHHNFLSDTMARLVACEQVVARNPDALFNNVVHVDDLARFAEELLVSLPRGHQVTTIASDDPMPIREVLAVMEHAARHAGAIRYENGGRSFLISNERARALGYRPASVRQSVQHYVASWRPMDWQSIA